MFHVSRTSELSVLAELHAPPSSVRMRTSAHDLVPAVVHSIEHSGVAAGRERKDSAFRSTKSHGTCFISLEIIIYNRVLVSALSITLGSEVEFTNKEKY